MAAVIPPRKDNMATLVAISKFLSKHLRHSPEVIGLTLEVGGWVKIDDLISACQHYGLPISLADLNEVVDNCEKQRFSFNETKDKIRANQGHSTQVEMDFKQETPPNKLYHGTVDKFMKAIMTEGIKKMKRHHVHLSKDLDTATKVGARRGKPIILEVDAGAMHAVGYKFYISANGVWLTDIVPAFYLRRI